MLRRFIVMVGVGGFMLAAFPAPPTAQALTPMTVISRNVPAFTNDDCGGSYPASFANDNDYTTDWRSCNSTPSVSHPKWLIYDLSGVPATSRGMVILAWYNDPNTSEYDHTIDGSIGYNNVGSYTIQVNPAPGGTVPTTGWVTKATVTNNTYSSRQHLVNMAGNNWLRLYATASDGSPGNSDIAIDMDVHDASAGANDDIIFYGDSITQDGMPHDTRVAVDGTTVGTYAQLVNAQKPAYFPAYQDGGIGGLLSADGAAHINTWLALFPGHYVTLNYGTNDADAGAGDPSIVQPFHDNMAAMVQAVLTAGKVPILPTIPWARQSNLQVNIPTLNKQIALLYTQYPGILHGPDLYAYFSTHQSLISDDGIHPSWDNGYAAYRQQWANWAVSTLYV